MLAGEAFAAFCTFSLSVLLVPNDHAESNTSKLKLLLLLLLFGMHKIIPYFTAL